MSPTQRPFQNRNCSSGFHESDPNNYEDFFGSCSEDKESIAASIDELSESTYRSPSQKLAVESLRDFEDSKLLEWLSIIRLSGSFGNPYSQGLSNEQFDALSHLKFCPDSHILLWLRNSRARSQYWKPQTSSLPTNQVATTASSCHVRRRPPRTSPRSSAELSDNSLAYDGTTNGKTTGNSLSRQQFLAYSPLLPSDQEYRPSRITKVQSYWCTDIFCEKHLARYPYTTSDGWKRHMKEHDTVWLCMPYGPLETADNGSKCALCGSLEPDESHMARHSVGDCGNTSTKLRGVSRRTNLEKHLKSHGVPDGSTRALADRWRTTLRKKYFACGFCICIFSTIHEQLNHIDVDHFKQGQEITQWSGTKVIRSLLLSPEVASSFQRILVSDRYALARDLHWDRNVIKDLQRRLEIAEEAAEILATEAYNLLAFNLSRQNSDGPHSSVTPTVQESVPPRNSPIGYSAVSGKSPEENSELQVRELTQAPERHGFSDECHLTAASTNFPMPNYGIPVIQRELSEASTSMKYQQVYPTLQGGFQTISGSSVPKSQSISIPAQTGSASGNTGRSSEPAYDSSATSAHWQAAVSNTPSTLHTTGAAEMPREQPNFYGGHVYKGWTASCLPSDLDDVSQLPNVEEGLSLPGTYDRGQMQLWASPDKLKHHYDVIPDSDHLKEVMQNDRGHQTDPLTCDPRDLIKESRWHS